jgi:hypothetical protein
VRCFIALAFYLLPNPCQVDTTWIVADKNSLILGYLKDKSHRAMQLFSEPAEGYFLKIAEISAEVSGQAHVEEMVFGICVNDA